MNFAPLMSKITERGQITLPKRLRNAPIFHDARVVEFEERSDAIIIRPVKRVTKRAEHQALLDHTMRDWSHPDNDNLFDFTPQ